ncbi:MAG: riboflavin kinase [Candidatus Gracilibacteria bacterium]|nr:riboflavin kinase [Candidatus Gracilibacteria bacterium]
MIKTITGKVIYGNKNGGKFLFKTANIPYTGEKNEDGVYKVNVKIEDKKYAGVGSYLKEKGVFETHIFDFEKDIYDKEIKVYLLEKIRENKRFENFEELKKQIEKDIIYAKNKKIKVMTFGTFDIFHPGHKHFLKQASFYGDTLITVIARDKNVEKFKRKLPKNNENIRLEEVKKSEISDIVELGDYENPFLCIENHKPNTICLGYDQEGFYDKLKKKDEFKDIEIIRLEAYKPEIYKSSKL